MRRRPHARSRRLHVALAAAALATMPAALAASCGSGEAPIEDLCGWLSDADNCHREFFRDVGDRCGSFDLESGARDGSFLSRDALDVCVLSKGGQVIFDPPLEFGAFPLTSASFKIIDAKGLSCGAGSYSSPYLFSVTVDPESGAGGGGGGSATTDDEDLVAGGTFSTTSPAGRQTFDASCPTGEAHHFDRLQVTKCTRYEGLLPRAELLSSAGGITPIRGYVRFRVFYPNLETSIDDAQTVGVEYFDCSIPGAPKACANGVQDGQETDVDCGGEACPTGNCDDDQCARCAAGLRCNVDSDCESGACELDNGILMCAEAAEGGGG
jgi:hypothetical protein